MKLKEEGVKREDKEPKGIYEKKSKYERNAETSGSSETRRGLKERDATV